MNIQFATPYQILGITEVDVDTSLTVHFRSRILEFKHDQSKPPEQQTFSAEWFRLVCRAYETLSNPSSRKYYDQTKKWKNCIPVEQYTLQQLVAEPILFPLLERQLSNTTLRAINAQHPESGQTPLYCAARVGHVKAVRCLTEHGAETDLKQKSNSTALHVAAFYGHGDVVRCLLESGADYTQKNAYDNLAEKEAFNDDVRQAFRELKTDAYVQAAANQLEWFKQNATSLPHPDFQYHYLCQTLLHCASKKGHTDLVTWLVTTQHANLDIIDINLNSALHLAAYGKHRSIVKFLLENGADPLLINRWGMTAEEEGCIHGESIKKIFQSMRDQDMFIMATAGADWWFRYYFGKNSPNQMNSAGVTVLYVACRCGNTSVAKWLLEHGANINMRNRDVSRSTSLHGAVYHGHISIVELLLSYGADVNLRNKYGATVFDEVQSNEIKRLLQQYRQDLTANRFISVHLFGDGASSGNEPLVKLQIQCDATFTELRRAMPEAQRLLYTHFSMARRPLNVNSDDILVVPTVCRARYGKTKFIELPLCITAHESPRYTHSGHVMGSELSFHNLRRFQGTFSSQCETVKIKVKVSDEPQQFTLNKFLLTFPSECAHKSVSIHFDYIFSPDYNFYGLEGCICIVQTRYSHLDSQLSKMPTLSLINESNVYLYTWTQSSAYWFTSNNRDAVLPLIGGIHAFIKHVDIIPSLFTLPGDMFMHTALNNLFISRIDPVRCRCLKIREHDAQTFPYIAYHGTKIQVVRSILMDGFVMPSTVVSSGLRVCPPSNHIARGLKKFGVADFSNAIFLSPSIHYCCDPCYAVTFSYNDECMFPVLECAVKNNAFSSFPSTVTSYVSKKGDDIKNIEWRLTNPAAIEILSILFIPIIESRTKAVKSRAKILGVDPNDFS